MKKTALLLSLSLVAGSCFATSDSAWRAMLTAYGQGNLAQLNQYSSTNNHVADYLLASASLDKKNPQPALDFIQTSEDSFMRNDVLHQLLDYYFNQQAWNNYLNIYQQLPINQASSNEDCGYDLANFALNNHQAQKSNFDYLIANKVPLWCISLVASKLNNKSLSKSYQQPFLYSLITNGQTSQFNQLADTLGYSQVNFNSNTPADQLSNSYQITYRINAISNKTPDIAYAELSKAKLDSFTKSYLYNQIADDLATKQMFSLSLNALAQGNNSWVSDDEYEWRVRSYLYSNNWQKIYDTINGMPNKLQTKSAWLYWKAFAAGKLGLKTTAEQTLQQIPPEYNFYSLLAQSELKTPLNLDYQPKATSLNNLQDAGAVAQDFALYQTAKDIASPLLTRIATQDLYYIIAKSNDNDIAAISNKALNLGWSEMSIYAANHLRVKSAVMSFPLLFTPQFKQYAKQNNLSPSFTMAVTRQESRFNPNALAFDGGVGLMQIMPATADYIAKKLKSSNCFKNYACNIQFGSWFLGHLVTQFGNNPIYAAAGYNAGPGRANRWQQNFKAHDNRIQIELIPFKITRDYVQKVLSNKLIYDGLLNNNSQADMRLFLSSINNQKTTFIGDDDNTQGDATGSVQN